MPPKIAKRGTAAQIKNAIAQTQAVPSQANREDHVRQAIAKRQRAGPSQASQDDVVQPDEEIQVDDETQPEEDVPTSSADSNIVNDAVASTADGADTGTPDTIVSSAHETETEPAIKKPAAKKVGGKKVPAADGKKSGNGTKTTRRRKRDPTNFSAYIHKVQRQVHPDCSISSKAMQILNDFIKDICTRIADLASDLCKKLKKPTLQAHDIQTATKLILAGELAKHALSEGGKALRTFNKATDQGLR